MSTAHFSSCLHHPIHIQTTGRVEFAASFPGFFEETFDGEPIGISHELGSGKKEKH